jgi:hypothetical protein
MGQEVEQAISRIEAALSRIEASAARRPSPAATGDAHLRARVQEALGQLDALIARAEGG